MKKVAVLLVALLAAVGTALAVEEAGTAAGTVAVATDAEAAAAASAAAESQAQAQATAAASAMTDAELEAGAETDAELSADAAAEDALDRQGKSRPINCMDAKVRGVLNRAGNTGNGVYWVKPLDGGRGFFIWCDMTTDGGGWNVFSRRFNGETDFYRPWKAYKHGFGSKRGEHWLGLDKIHRLSKTMPHTLRINLVGFDGSKGYGTWRTFMVDDEEHKYTLTARKFRDFGIGNSLRYHSGRPFSTYDRDNDAWANNCASYFHGAWWYGACHNSNLNGKYYPFPGKHPRNYADGADWLTFKGHFESAKRLKMMFK